MTVLMNPRPVPFSKVVRIGATAGRSPGFWIVWARNCMKYSLSAGSGIKCSMCARNRLAFVPWASPTPGGAGMACHVLNTMLPFCRANITGICGSKSCSDTALRLTSVSHSSVIGIIFGAPLGVVPAIRLLACSILNSAMVSASTPGRSTSATKLPRAIRIYFSLNSVKVAIGPPLDGTAVFDVPDILLNALDRAFSVFLVSLPTVSLRGLNLDWYRT